MRLLMSTTYSKTNFNKKINQEEMYNLIKIQKFKYFPQQKILEYMDTFRFTFFVSVTFYNSKTMKSKKKFQFWTIAENDSMSLNCIQDFPRSGATILTFLEYLITWFSLTQSNQFSICRLAINLTNLQAPSWSPPTLVILLAKKGACCFFKLLILPPFFQGNDDQKLKMYWS